jgi:hypothetical protein
VAPVNDAPIARNATFRMQQDGNVCIDFASLIADIDGDALTLSFGNPRHGTPTRTSDGHYLYRPDRNFSGTDTFTYTVSDDRTSTSAMITLDVDRRNYCGDGARIQVTRLVACPSSRRRLPLHRSEPKPGTWFEPPR